MTDNNVVSMTPQDPAIPQQPLTDEQRIDSIKMFLFQGILKHYQEFSASINRLPCDQNLKRIIVEKVDDTWLWVKEAFNVLQIQLPQPLEATKVPSKTQSKSKKIQKSKKR